MPNNAFEADPPSRRAPSPDGALILRVQTLENEIKEALKQRNRADKQLKAAAEENTRLKNEVEKLQRQERDLTNKLKENPGHTQIRFYRKIQYISPILRDGRNLQ